jgi:hypothetical protein
METQELASYVALDDMHRMYFIAANFAVADEAGNGRFTDSFST